MELSDDVVNKMQKGGSFVVNNPADLDKSKKRVSNSSGGFNPATIQAGGSDGSTSTGTTNPGNGTA